MKELKTRTTSITLTPTDFRNLKKVANIQNTQMSVLVGKLIKQYLAENEHLIQKWDETFGSKGGIYYE